ncbi:MAG TPA: hypothetical protein VFR15_01590 [Chloroflexia bacterium]|nr:hypothetical protein [Chloroflexia bacterium]
MDINETSTIDLEERLRSHYEHFYGGPRSSATVLAGIADRLGSQEGKELVEFARSVDALFHPDSRTSERAPAQGVETRLWHDAVQRRLLSRTLWSPAIAAGLVLALVATLVVVMTLTNQNGDRTIPASTPGEVLEYIDLKNPGFEDGLAPWVKSSQPYQTNYSVGVDETVAFSGKASALLKSIVADPKGNATLASSMEVAGYQGKRVRLSGYLRSETIVTDMAEGRAGLWMNVSGSMPGLGQGQTTMLAMDNMMDRPVIGTTGWQRYDVVLDLPPGAERIAFGAALAGPGKVWVDDVWLEVVSAEVPSTEHYRGTSTQFQNLDFENGLAGWNKFSSRFTAYEAGTDEEVKHGGEASGYLKAVKTNLEAPVELGQRIHADKYRGQRVRLTVFAKTAGVEKGGGLAMGSVLPDGTAGPYDDMSTRLITGTNDWQKVEIVLDVPADATTVMFAAHLNGAGQIWLDDLQVEVVGKDVPLTSPGQ